MEIIWYGQSCFQMSERGLPTWVTDPYDNSLGYPPLPNLAVGVATLSHEAPGHANRAALAATTRVLDGPGEYEIGGVFFTGIATGHDNVVFVADWDGLTVCHLGDLNRKLTQAEVEALGRVDVLLVPVGGGRALNAAQAAECVALLEPSLVVPMHYRTPTLTLPLDPVSKFLKEMGLTQLNPETSLRLTRANLPAETRVVVLEPQLRE